MADISNKKLNKSIPTEEQACCLLLNWLVALT